MFHIHKSGQSGPTTFICIKLTVMYVYVDLRFRLGLVVVAVINTNVERRRDKYTVAPILKQCKNT